jgi:hypothetical protein
METNHPLGRVTLNDLSRESPGHTAKQSGDVKGTIRGDVRQPSINQLHLVVALSRHGQRKTLAVVREHDVADVVLLREGQ